MTAAKRKQQKRRLTILGATGTIGQNTLDLVQRNPERFEIIALTGNQNTERLAREAIKHRARFAAVADPAGYADLKQKLQGTNITCGAGPEAIMEAASMEADICMAAIVGIAGLAPTLAAMQRTKIIALANKECLVSAGALFLQTAKQEGATLIPVDSEHSAAFQCLLAENPANIEMLTLTASGGPFRSATLEQISKVTKAEALNHPNWDMGAKISIDSATLMNKGLELIEAKYLFNLPPDAIDMVVHPQSIIHCLVSFRDGAMLAQLSQPDMRVPIAYSLAWPERMPTPIKPVNLAEMGQLTFEKGCATRFPCLKLARETLYNADALGPVLNAANEIAVEAFLNDQIPFHAIPALIEDVMQQSERESTRLNPHDLDAILDRDQRTRAMARAWLANGTGFADRPGDQTPAA